MSTEESFVTAITDGANSSEYHGNTTTSPVDDESQTNCDTYRLVISGGVLGGLCIFGTVANILTLIVLPRFARMARGSSPTTLLLAALAVWDAILLGLLFLLQAMPAYCIHPSSLCTTFWSRYVYLAMWGWPCVSVANMLISWIVVLTTVHRYILVCHPHRAKDLCTMRKTRIELAVVIIVVLLYEIPIFTDYKLVEVVGEDNSTSLQRVYTTLGQSDVYQVTYKTTIYYIFVFIIPILIISVLTALLLRALRQSSKMRNTMATGQTSTTSAEDEITRTLLAVVAVYLCCQPWEPARRVVEAIEGSQPGCPSFYFYFQPMPGLFEGIMASLNFVLFCMFGSKFRRAFLTMFSCCREETEDAVSSVNESNLSTSLSTISITCQGK